MRAQSSNVSPHDEIQAETVRKVSSYTTRQAYCFALKKRIANA